MMIMARFLFLWIIAFNAVAVAQITNGPATATPTTAPPTSAGERDPMGGGDLNLTLTPSPTLMATASVSFLNTPDPTTSATAGLATQSTSSKPHKSPNTAAIAGGVIGGLGGLLLIALLVYFLRRRLLSKRSRDSNDYGKTPSDLVYRTTDMSSDSSPIAHQTQYGQLSKAIEQAYPASSQEPNYAEQHNTSHEAAKVILSPTAIRPQGHPAPTVLPTNELDSTEVNEDGVSVRSPSPDINVDGRLDSIRGPTPTPESQASRGRVPRLPLISRTKGHDPTI
ncbi:MAG: hypothetical protein M1840_009167 [Geoglossum simile]|nr:MAG: hypothetical protein M1840_009167 [Geoglossum simile]